MIKPKLGVFGRDGRRVDIQPKDMVLYIHKPTLVYCLRLDFDGELREGRGVRKFRAGDYYCVNQGGCRFVTTARYVAYAYTKVEERI